MREGWEVWLLPNQATGKQGVPRYIKVDPETASSEPSTEEVGKEASGDPEQVRTRAACCYVHDLCIMRLGENGVLNFSEDARKRLAVSLETSTF